MKCLEFDGQQIGNKVVSVKLLTPNWNEQVKEEMKLMQANTAAMFNSTSHSLLGEDFSTNTEAYDMDGMEHDCFLS